MSAPDSPTLFSTLRVGELTLPNRLIMAPMTRQRASAEGLPTEIMRTYYVQRAGAGLIISEGISPEAIGRAHLGMPGIHTAQQIEGWRVITRAVHEAGGRIYAQLMHAGRMTRPDLLPDHATPIAPSAVRPNWKSRVGVPYVVPRALSTAQVRELAIEYGRAAGRCIQAGFDGAELHAASGYLPMQFLSSGTNQRDDEYGGNALGRCRFVIEALQAMCAEVGAARVGIKVSPEMKYNDISDQNPLETHRVLLEAIGDMNLAYLHIALFGNPTDYLGELRPMFHGPCIAGGGLDHAAAQHMVSTGRADAAAFGTLYVGNPDLHARFARGAPLNESDRSTFYSSGPEGYIDYPSLP